ncbi:MAG: protein phosphatase [Clostridia bacterium]|nr:protein phosphatase [Clostridia bacterium]
MNKEMNLSELFKEVTEENTIRKILMILENCKDLEEAIEKIKDLLK